MGVTSRYSLPYPELADTPNIPSDMEALATRLDSVIGVVEDEELPLATIVGGEIVPTGALGAHDVHIGFQPQLVEFITQWTSTLDSGGTAASLSIGRLYVPVGGGTAQFLTGARVLSGFYERRTARTICAGLMEDSTTILASAIGSFISDGFSLDFTDNSTSVSIFWVAYQ